MADNQKSMEEAWETSQISGTNAAYLDELYERYLQDSSSVDPKWANYFASLKGHGAEPSEESSHGAIKEQFIQLANQPASVRTSVDASSSPSVDGYKYSAVMDLINAYRHIGHRHAKLDPLGLQEVPKLVELDIAYYGLSQSDLNLVFDIPDFKYAGVKTLAEILAELKRIYTSTVGIEYMHIANTEERTWLKSRVENKESLSGSLTSEDQLKALKGLVAADGLEKYLGIKFVGQKRFSLEGGDAFIPLLDELIRSGIRHEVKEAAICMAHRGRLNTLVNILGKSPEMLFAEFEGKHSDDLLAGDVKYHMGFSADLQTTVGSMHVALAFNPSHLEAAYPVICGSVRARQLRRDFNRREVMGIVVHGDSAFIGEGVVMETLNLSQTRFFKTGGTVHLVINNQLGFTTSRQDDMRSSHYCTDATKMIDAPVFHVNADDIDQVIKSIRLAVDYRMKFGKDVVVDLICYRTHGHNESDEPSGTQPLMYRTIKKHKTPREIYANQLIEEGILTADEARQMVTDYRAQLEAGKPVSPIVTLEQNENPFIIDWAPYMGCPWDVACSTQLNPKDLVAVAKRLDSLPDGFVLQRQVQKAMDDRAKMTEGQLPINWGYAEILAYATLLKEGFAVRLSGQDSGRGTFSHRHGVLHHFETGESYIPLQHVAEDQRPCIVVDSVLSEEAVLGFEYGYSASAPKALVLWEAQFGDFVNSAQVYIDQFIASAEEKWGRLCGLVMLLPHGYEGMGAEHSSARLERFLQLCANNNMQVCNPTLPSQMYHMLRRQMLRQYRKPLIVMTPKSLLRHPQVTSTLEDLATGQFEVVLDEISSLSKDKVERVILCSGKVYYDLYNHRDVLKDDKAAIIRIEQLYPFPNEVITEVLSQYTAAKTFVWAQEEPKNQGAWLFIQPMLEELLNDGMRLKYAGRPASSAPAVGYPALHKTQQVSLVEEAFKV